ncbi:serine threonine protein kinase [Pelomyxa schiedti]|nr:serine threonine protein kinase [Pelomyxa schiedti]
MTSPLTLLSYDAMTAPPTPLSDDQRVAMMLEACRRVPVMPEFPSPTWDINTHFHGIRETMLHIACSGGDESVVKRLLDVGASRNPPIDPNSIDKYGDTPLCYAACWGKEAVARMLVARPDVDVNKGCPLVIACSSCRMGVVVALLECPRVDVNLVVQIIEKLGGQTALLAACERGFVEGVKVLLKVNGIDTNCKNRDGETPLDVATRCKFTDICNLLKDHRSQSSRPTTVKQLKRELTELNARITQLEDENAKNLKRLQDERECRYVTQQRFRELQRKYQGKQNSEMELQRLQEKSVLDMTAKNKELMELEAHITTLEEESARNLKIFCDERESEQQRLRDHQHYMNHVMSHVEQGDGSWRNILLPENNSHNNKHCKPSKIRIAFEEFASFDEIVCGVCPLQMVVKLIVSRKFGVEPSQQLIFIGPENNTSEEVLMDSSITFDDIIQQQQQGNSSTDRVVVQFQVRIKSTVSIQETDLKVVSTLGSGSYGTVFKCTFLHNTATTSTFSSSSSSSSETTFVAVKSLHEIIKSEFNITQFQQEALISSRLRHPNIVRCLGTCVTSTGSLWIVSELMELSLRQLLHHKTLTFMEVVAVSSGIAKGMTALHMRNFMHRDLSSNNVLLDSCGIPKIADFGVSRALPTNSAGTGTALLRTFTNGAGTPVYLSPQMHTRHYGIKGDMWEFAVLLSEILRGTTPDTIVPKAATQILEFIRVQRTRLSPTEIAEVDRLCTDAGDYPVVECLIRRNAIIEALRLDQELNNTHPACVGQFSLVVESCLSILEINRPSFPVIERMLMTCAEIVFANSRNTTTATTAANTTANAPMIDNRDVAAHITTCLANMAASFPGRRNNNLHTSSSPSSTTSSSRSSS